MPPFFPAIELSRRRGCQPIYFGQVPALGQKSLHQRSVNGLNEVHGVCPLSVVGWVESSQPAHTKVGFEDSAHPTKSCIPSKGLAKRTEPKRGSFRSKEQGAQRR